MLIAFLACMGKKGIDQDYYVDPPSHVWVELPPNAADRAWKNPKQNALIYVKANCGKYFEDRSLEDSLLSLTRGIHFGAPVTTEELRIANRQALFQVIDSEIDGVPFRLGLVVLSKNNCLYDFLFISPKKSFSDGIADFMNTAQSLQTKVQQ